MEKYKNYLINNLNSKLEKKLQMSLSNYLFDIDSYISRLMWAIEKHVKDYLDSIKYIDELKNQIKDLQKEVYQLQLQNSELRNERNFDLDNYKLIIAEIKDPETISAIAKAVLKHGKS